MINHGTKTPKGLFCFEYNNTNNIVAMIPTIPAIVG